VPPCPFIQPKEKGLDEGPSKRGSLLRFLAQAGGEKPWRILIPKEIPQLSG